MAAMYALSAAGTGYFGYTMYKLHSGATASFQVERSDPAPAALTTIRNAKRLAIYPSGGQSDGDDIDIFRASTDMEVVSSSQTIAWVEKNRVPKLSTLPSTERLAVASRIARDNRADLAIMFIAMDADVKVNFISSTPEIKNLSVNNVYA
ncbi:MAG: hypothetical protein IT510_15395 [Sulfuritalea sp.]|nr:hypothetical protein [Sulfuritalea sp.]